MFLSIYSTYVNFTVHSIMKIAVVSYRYSFIITKKYKERSISSEFMVPEVRGSSVWQISKKYFAGVIYGQKSLMC